MLALLLQPRTIQILQTCADNVTYKYRISLRDVFFFEVCKVNIDSLKHHASKEW